MTGKCLWVEYHNNVFLWYRLSQNIVIIVELDPSTFSQSFVLWLRSTAFVASYAYP